MPEIQPVDDILKSESDASPLKTSLGGLELKLSDLQRQINEQAIKFNLNAVHVKTLKTEKELLSQTLRKKEEDLDMIQKQIAEFEIEYQ
jgi:chromosome segregation ATPase